MSFKGLLLIAGVFYLLFQKPFFKNIFEVKDCNRTTYKHMHKYRL